jgi:protein gp37
MTERYKGKSGWPKEFGLPKTFLYRLEAAIKWKDLTGTDRPDKPWLNGMPRLIFFNDMGDTFTESLPLDWFGHKIPEMEASPHIWLILTKRPRRMYRLFKAYGHVPDNFWLGTTVMDQATANARIIQLLTIEGCVKWLSLEPLLGPIDLWQASAIESDGAGGERGGQHISFDRGLVDWVVVGGESGQNKRKMELAWARDLRDQCKSSSLPYFFKQVDKVQPIPDDLNIREMPRR